MARVVSPSPITPEVSDLLREAAPQVQEDEWQRLSARLDHATPFLVDQNGIPLPHANAYLRKRAVGQLEEFSFKRLAANSRSAFASDLAYFLNTYSEPSPELITLNATTADLLHSYVTHLESPGADLKASTIARRTLVAREFTLYLGDELNQEPSPVNKHATEIRRTILGDSEHPLSCFATPHLPATRRRSPTTIYILPPEHLRTFIKSILDPVHRTIAKLIYATGMRRSEVVRISVREVMALKPLYPNGPAHMIVVGKGNKSRTIELEPEALKLLRNMLTSKDRLRRLKRATPSAYADPGSVPLFINQFGKPMSGEAVGDAFLRASERRGLKRTPHELRHEFATQYLLNAYRELAQRLMRDHLETWLARLMIDKTSLIIEKLARLLGHSSSETTKKVYLAAIMNSEPSVRDAWCRHLDNLELADL